MTLEAGQMLAHYRLASKIGEGGMGVVWRATDTTLEREVAIKILPDDFARDAERTARFEREAKLLASLAHPNLATVYGLHQSGAVRFLAMELVEGEDLSQRLERGPIALEEALAIARQVAAAMEEAHAHGIIHRDLKPGNIKLTPEGKAKVLDLGLAKALAGPAPTPDQAQLSRSPTLTVGPTLGGTILGTVAYMSPEQARGQPADRRADLWAFGVVLYEMLTGERLFGGSSVSDVLAEVLKTDPDWERLPTGTPMPVRRLLRRCLERDPEQRLRDFGDARLELEEAPEADYPAAVGERAPAGHRRTVGWLAAVALTALITAAVTWMLQPAAPPRVEKLDLVVPELGFGYPEPAKVSPDGQRIAFSRGNRLWIRDLDRLEPRPVNGSAGGASPFWSPDSQWLGFVARGRLWKVPAEGGERVVIGNIPGGLYSGWGGDVSWGDRGTVVLSTGWTGLLTVPASGGEVTEWLAPEEGDLDFHDPAWLPGERGVVFNVHRADHGMDLLALWDGKKRSTVLELPGDRLHAPVYSPTGHILFHRGGTELGVWALPFALDSLEAAGEPFPVLPDGGHPSVADDGTLVTIHGAGFFTQVVLVDETGQAIQKFGEPIPLRYAASLSPDGRTVAFNQFDAGNEDVWSLDLQTGAKQRLTFSSGPERFARWSPDGQSVVCECFEGGASSICRIAADGTGEPLAVGRGFTPSFAPDGEGIVFQVPRDGWTSDLVYLAAGSDEPVPIVAGLRAGIFHDVSPDGDFVAYEAATGDRTEVFVTGFPDGEGRWQVSSGGGTNPRWSRDAKRLYFVRDTDLMVVDVDRQKGFSASAARPLFDEPDPSLAIGLLMAFDEMPGGRGFVMLQHVTSTGKPASLMIFRNWTAALGIQPE